MNTPENPSELEAELTDAGPAEAGPKVYLETFGCQMNVLDTELVTGALKAQGYHFVHDWKQADVVLYNTCSVREKAEQKVWSRVGKVGIHKRDTNPEQILGVIGCMAERDGEHMITKYPQIDLLCGPGELDKVPQLVDNAMKTQLAQRGGKRNAKANDTVALQGNTHRRSSTLAAAADDLEYLDLSRAFNPDGPAAGRSAYVRITRGCNKFCSYCVVPNTRGREVHRPPSHILEECRRLVASGVREITLLGQTVNHYHFDTSAAVEVDGVIQPQIGSTISPNSGTGGPSPVFGESVVSFADLLAMIHDELPELLRLRFVTSLPRDFGDDILDVIAARPRICNYFHLPVQSGSNAVLRAMNRGYTVEDYKDLIERIRERMPDAELATDIIVGFPGETEEDVQATADLIKWARFKNSFIFKYSPRPGTAAYEAAEKSKAKGESSRFDDNIPDQEKKKRNNDLLAIQSEISREIHEGYVGKTVPVFVEGVSQVEQRSRDAEYANSGANAAAPGTGQTITLGWSASESNFEKRENITQLAARTEGDLIVCFDGDDSLIGEIVDVKIEKAAALTLFGTVA